jgi:hypothetical protein
LKTTSDVALVTLTTTAVGCEVLLWNVPVAVTPVGSEATDIFSPDLNGSLFLTVIEEALSRATTIAVGGEVNVVIVSATPDGDEELITSSFAKEPMMLKTCSNTLEPVYSCSP